MRRAKLTFLAAIAVCLPLALVAWARGGYHKENAEESIKALQAQIVPAFLKGDPSFIEKYYADDAWVIHGDGKMTTKAEEIANLKSGVNKYESIGLRDQEIRVYGDIAIVNAVFSVKGRVNGEPYSGDVRNIRVWVRQKGSWRVISYSTTRILSTQ